VVFPCPKWLNQCLHPNKNGIKFKVFDKKLFYFETILLGKIAFMDKPRNNVTIFDAAVDAINNKIQQVNMHRNIC
jgi:hypothetical protein